MSSVFGDTVTPARTGICSMRPAVTAAMMRMCSGTSVPAARTSRSSSPRFTESTQSVARSTPGAAGFSLLMPSDTTTMPTIPAPQRMYCFFFERGSRLISTRSVYGGFGWLR